MNIIFRPLEHCSFQTKFLATSMILFVGELLHGIFQEVVHKSYAFPFPTVVVLLNFAFYSVASSIELRFEKHTPRLPRSSKALIWIVILVLSLYGNRYFGILSLKYIDFGTKIIFQSAKLFPLMVIGLLCMNKKYGIQEYMVVAMLVAGLIFFSLASSSPSSHHHHSNHSSHSNHSNHSSQPGDSGGNEDFSLLALGWFLAFLSTVTMATKSISHEILLHECRLNMLEVEIWSSLLGLVLALPIFIAEG